jgi:hypothetical protein
LVDLPIDYYSGTRIGGGRNGGQYDQYGQYQYSENSRQGFVEHLRISPDGKLYETQYQLMATHQDAGTGDTARYSEGGEEQGWGAWGWGGGGRRPNYPGAPQDYYQQQQRPVARGFFAPWDDRRGWQDRRGSWSGWPF